MNTSALTFELAIRQVDEAVSQAERRQAMHRAAGRSHDTAPRGAGTLRRLVGGAMIAAGQWVHGRGPALVGQTSLRVAR